MHSATLLSALFTAGVLAKPYHEGHARFHERRQEDVVVATDVDYATAYVTVTATQGAPVVEETHSHEHAAWTPAAPVVTPSSTYVAPAAPAPTSSEEAPAPAPASSSAAATTSASSGGSYSSSGNQYLDYHNQHRAMHGATPMQWDSSLESRAQAIANSCPNGDKDDGQSPSVGSNWSGGTDLDLFNALNMWYTEEPLYSAASAGYTQEPNGGGDWGHFSQMVWNASTHVGCAVNKACSGYSAQYTCLYYPQGNFAVENAEGQSNSYVENVFAPTTAGQ